MENVPTGKEIACVRLFADLEEQVLERVALAFQVRRYGNGEIVFSEGNPCAGLYIVKQGRAKLFRSSDGKQQLLALAGPGDPLDLVPLLDDGCHTCTAKARGPIELYFMDALPTHELIWNNSPLLMAVLRAVGDRLRVLCTQVTSLAFKDVRSRLCEWLVKTAEQEGRPQPDGIHFDPVLSQGELAALIGTGREVVWRALRKLEEENLIAVQNGEIVVLDAARLAALA